MSSRFLTLAGLGLGAVMLAACSGAPSMYAVKEGTTAKQKMADAVECGAHERFLDTGVQIGFGAGDFEKCMTDKGYEIIKA